VERGQHTLEGVATDDAGNVYGGFTNTLNFRRFREKNRRDNRSSLPPSPRLRRASKGRAEIGRPALTRRSIDYDGMAIAVSRLGRFQNASKRERQDHMHMDVGNQAPGEFPGYSVS